MLMTCYCTHIPIETAQDYQKLQNDKFHSGMDICRLTTSTSMQASANPCSYLEVLFNIQCCQFVVGYMNKWNEYLGMLPIDMVWTHWTHLLQGKSSWVWSIATSQSIPAWHSIAPVWKHSPTTSGVCLPSRDPHLQKDIKVLERVQKSALRMCKNMNYENLEFRAFNCLCCDCH